MPLTELRQLLKTSHVATWDNRQLIEKLIDQVEKDLLRIDELEKKVGELEEKLNGRR